jgi:hypothetical protein
MIRPGKLPSHYGPASVLGVAIGAVSFVVIGKVLCDLPLPFPVRFWDQHMTGWIAIRLNDIDPIFFPGIADRYSTYLQHLPAERSPQAVTARFDVAMLMATLVGAAVTWVIGRPYSDTKILAGRHLFEGKAAHHQIAQVVKDEIARSGEGVKLHKSFPWAMSRDRETTHFWMIGSVGSGKTVAINSLVDSVLERISTSAGTDKVLIYDNKGDFTSTLNTNFALLAPWDARSMVWDIAKDCTNLQDARELAAYIVAEGHDPMWHQAARQILAAVIQQLQCEMPGQWTWSDLHQLACSSQEKLLAIIECFAPEALNFIQSESKTTDGILINLGSSLADVAVLAKVWGSSSLAQRFSLSEWLLDPNPEHRVVILQGSGRYPEMTKGYVQAAISLLAGRINSAELPDDRQRRVWLVLDEFPQLGKLDRVGSIIAVGRSKGVCCVLGVQDASQIMEIYGEHAGKAWPAMIKTQIIARTNPGETADYIAKMMVGYATIERTIMHLGELQPPKTEQQLVIEPSEIADYLGPDKTGVKAMVLGFGDAHILQWPYTDYPKLRAPAMPAAWTLPPDQQVPSNNHHTEETTTMTKEKPRSTDVPATSKKPRLKLRPATPEEIHEMAVTGSDIRDAADPINELSATPRGGEQ